MFELLEYAVNIAGDIAFLVLVPVEREAAVEGAGPFDGETVVGLEGVDEVLSIGFGEIFDAEVVDTEDEGGAYGLLTPKAWSE